MVASRIFAPRRVLTAVAIALLCATGLAASIAAGQEGETDEPSSLTVPSPRTGDRGHWDITLEGDWEYDGRPEGKAFPFAAFEWLPPAPLLDGQGRNGPRDVVDVAGLVYTPWNATAEFNENGVEFVDGDAWTRSGLRHWVSPASWPLDALGYADGTVQQSSLIQPDPAGPAGQVPNPTVLQSTVSLNVTVQAFLDEADLGLCGTSESYQGKTLQAGEGLTVESCYFGSLQYQRPTTRMLWVGWEDVDGIQAAHYTRDGHHLWLANGIAYPVQMRGPVDIDFYDSSQDDWVEMDANFTLRLTRLQQGSVDRVAGSMGAALAPMTEAAPPAWLLEEGSLAASYSLAEAFADTLELSESVKSMVDAEPDSYVAWASYFEFDAGNEEEQSWRLAVTDGHRAQYVVVIRRESTGAGPFRFPAQTIAPYPDAFTTSTTELEYIWEDEDVEGLLPLPEDVPSTLPTLAALAERWHAYAGPSFDGATPNSYGLQVTCWPDCKNNFSVVYDIGLSEVVQGTEPPTLQELQAGRVPFMDWRYRGSALMVDDHGMAGMFYSSDIAAEYGTAVDSPVPAPAATSADSPPAGIELTAAMLSPPLATGATLFGLSAALVYLLWPLIKGGGLVGLFSRIEGQELLQHPTRRVIMDAVEGEPGLHFKELQRRTGLANGTLVHHLGKLHKAGFVVRRQLGGYTCVFPGRPGAADLGNGVARSPGAQRVLQAIRDQPGISGLELSARCGLTPSTVAHHVQRLVAVGAVSGMRDGRNVRLTAVAA